MQVWAHLTLTATHLKHAQCDSHIIPLSSLFLEDVKRCSSWSRCERPLGLRSWRLHGRCQPMGQREWMGHYFSPSIFGWTAHSGPSLEDLGGSKLQLSLMNALVSSETHSPIGFSPFFLPPWSLPAASWTSVYLKSLSQAYLQGNTRFFNDYPSILFFWGPLPFSSVLRNYI